MKVRRNWAGFTGGRGRATLVQSRLIKTIKTSLRHSKNHYRNYDSRDSNGGEMKVRKNWAGYTGGSASPRIRG